MKFVSICDGLLLSYIDIHASIWEDNTPEPEKAMLRFNYCVNGRCEIELENDEITFLSGGELSLSRVSAKQEYKYPGGRYQGIEIFVYEKLFAGESLQLCGEDIVNMKELFSDFKGVFGKNYSSYQKDKRMELAAELLENTESKLSEIAGKIGYENHSKFSSAFKAYYKISPSDYRRKKRLEKIK